MTFENHSQTSKEGDSSSFILGGSRGLGRALKGQLPDAYIFSRSEGISLDLTKEGAVALIMDHVSTQKPNRIFYCAGGGPHGFFWGKSLKSHKWAMQLNALTPLSLAEKLVAHSYQGEFVYIGSAIAERSKVLSSLSYSTAKKWAKEALLALPEEKLKVRVFSPPYMDTGLLTPKAWPRQECPELVLNPEEVAQRLLHWLNTNKNWNSNGRHFDWIERFDYNLPSNKDI